MKRTYRSIVLTCLALCLFACSPLDIEFNDPQDSVTIQDEFMYEINGILVDNNDFVELFGEENIHFGPTPPTWNDTICFKVEGMEYDTCIRFIYDPYNDNAIIPSHAAPPDYDASINIHRLYDQDQIVVQHEMKTRDPWANYYLLEPQRVNIIGHDDKFTLYYQGITTGNGDPTVIMLISGTMVFDTITTNNVQTLVFKGVKDYLFGKKILDYEYQPTQAYAPGTIEIKRHPGLSPSCSWNDL